MSYPRKHKILEGRNGLTVNCSMLNKNYLIRIKRPGAKGWELLTARRFFEEVLSDNRSWGTWIDWIDSIRTQQGERKLRGKGRVVVVHR